MSDEQFNNLFNLIKNPTKTLVLTNPIISSENNYKSNNSDYEDDITISYNEQVNFLLQDKKKLLG